MDKTKEKEAKTSDEVKSRHGAALILYFLRGSVKFFVISIIASLLASFFEMINTQIVSFTVDTVLGTEKVSYPKIIEGFIDRVGGVSYLGEHLYLIAAVMLISGMISVLCRYVGNVYGSRGAQSFVESMRNKLFSHISRLPFFWHMKNPTGDIIQPCTSDVDMINNFVSRQLPSVVRTVLLIARALLFMFRMNA